MKILYIITQADGGGAQKYVLALGKFFKGGIACGNEKTSLLEEAKTNLLHTYELKHLKRSISLWQDLLATWEIYRLLKTIKPDVIHLNSGKAGFLGSVAGKLARAKVVFTAHGFSFLEPIPFYSKWLYLFAEKIARYFRDYIITVSDCDKNSAIVHHLISTNKISTIYNGLPKLDFLTRTEAKKQLQIPENKFIFGSIANFYKTKGLDILIQAVSLLPKEIKENSCVVLFGEGPEFSKLTNLDFQLETKIIFKGKTTSAAKFLKAFDCFVLPSRKEGFPFAILEAMQAGLPILATNVGGVGEALKDNGFLIEPENPKILCGAMVTIFKNQELRKTFSKKSPERAKIFSQEKMLAETEKIYNLVCGGK